MLNIECSMFNIHPEDEDNESSLGDGVLFVRNSLEMPE